VGFAIAKLKVWYIDCKLVQIWCVGSANKTLGVIYVSQKTLRVICPSQSFLIVAFSRL